MTTTIFPVFEATLEDTTYRIEPRPVHLAMIGAVIALGLFVALVVTARRKPGAVVNPLLIAVVSVPAALLSFVYVVRRMPYFRLFGGTDPARRVDAVPRRHPCRRCGDGDRRRRAALVGAAPRTA